MTDTKISVEDLSIDEMLDLKDAIETRLDALASAEVGTIEKRLERLKSYMNQEGVPEVRKVMRKTRKPRAAAKSVAAAPKKLAPAKGAKTGVKFRDPETGKTWSGRGPAPSWLRQYESKRGKSRADLAV